MAFKAYVSIVGSKQGKFRGTSHKINRSDGWTDVSEISYSAGKAKGQHVSLSFALNTGPATQQLTQALITSETLKTVTFELVSTNVAGAEFVSSRTVLTNATVSSIGIQTNTTGPTANQDTSVALAYQKIVLSTFQPAATTMDDWKPF